MATPFSDIYYKYNMEVTDNSLLSILTDAEMTELLETFLSKSRSVYFKNCTKDLTDINNTTKQFNVTLDTQEEWILAKGMQIVWIDRQILKEEKLRNRIGTKDYPTYSPSNLINSLISLKNIIKKDLDEMIVSYSYDGFDGFN